MSRRPAVGRVRVAAVPVVLAALVGLGAMPGVAAAETPPAPSDGQIAAAQTAADALTARLGQLSTRIAVAQASVDAARAASSIALDDYQAEEAAFQAATGTAATARDVAAAAAADVETARQQLLDFARRSYMDGSTYDGAASLVTAADPAELIERAVLLAAAGAHRSDVLAALAAAEVRAAQARAAAEGALQQADALRQQATAALDAARVAERAARDRAATLTAQQDGLRAQVAQAENQLAQLLGAREAADRAATEQAAAQGAAAQAARSAPPQLAAPSRSGGATAARATLVVDPRRAGTGPPTAGLRAIAAAAALLGTPYSWGGGGSAGAGFGVDLDAGVIGFDCSGLTQYAYARAGIAIPRNSRAQFAALPKVDRAALRAGDLVFWAIDPADPATIHHVALYLGDGRVLQAPESGDVIKISPMWWDGYAGAVRPGA